MIVARPLDEDQFASYGAVIRRPMTPGRIAFDGVLRCVHPDGKLRVSMSRFEPEALPRLLRQMERHANATQVFLPVSGSRYLVVTALGEREPDLATLNACVVPADIGIAYGLGVWHVPMMAIDAPATFLVLMHRVSSELDEDWHTLREPVTVTCTDDTDAPSTPIRGGNS
jgi:ureidoglycolate lyase